MKRLNKVFLMTSAFLMASTPMVQAQTMSLSDCIQYALQHSTTVQQQQLSVRNQKLQLNTSRWSRLPDLSASVSTGWSFGRTTSAESNGYESVNSMGTSFGISASMPVFTGFRITNQIRSDRYTLQATTANLDKARKDIGIQVATYYLNALYYRGLTDVQRQQVGLDSVAAINARALFDAGKKPESEVAAAEAQLAVSRHSLVEAMGNETLARLDLMQALNLEGSVEQFAVQNVDTSLLSQDIRPADLIFADAQDRYPTILAARCQLESSKYNLKVTKSSYMPSLYLSASYSTSYQYLYNSQYTLPSFADQFRNYGSKYVGLSLSIPIFNRFATRNSVRQARLSIENQNIALTEAQQSLYKEVQQAYWNAVKARDNYASARQTSASTRLSYQYQADRYAAGKGTAYDLQQASNQHQKSLQDELQARYEFLMRLKILDFYCMP